MFKYDSTHGVFKKSVELVDDKHISVDGHKISVCGCKYGRRTCPFYLDDIMHPFGAEQILGRVYLHLVDSFSMTPGEACGKDVDLRLKPCPPACLSVPVCWLSETQRIFRGANLERISSLKAQVHFNRLNGTIRHN